MSFFARAGSYLSRLPALYRTRKKLNFAFCFAVKRKLTFVRQNRVISRRFKFFALFKQQRRLGFRFLQILYIKPEISRVINPISVAAPFQKPYAKRCGRKR